MLTGIHLNTRQVSRPAKFDQIARRFPRSGMRTLPHASAECFDLVSALLKRGLTTVEKASSQNEVKKKKNLKKKIEKKFDSVPRSEHKRQADAYLYRFPCWG